MRHEVKTWCHLFRPLNDGTKTHDLRIMDRSYEVGDEILHKEWDPYRHHFTGRRCLTQITYITSDKHGHCAFSPSVLDQSYGILSVKLLKNNLELIEDDFLGEKNEVRSDQGA